MKERRKEEQQQQQHHPHHQDVQTVAVKLKLASQNAKKQLTTTNKRENVSSK